MRHAWSGIYTQTKFGSNISNRSQEVSAAAIGFENGVFGNVNNVPFNLRAKFQLDKDSGSCHAERIVRMTSCI